MTPFELLLTWMQEAGILISLASKRLLKSDEPLEQYRSEIRQFENSLAAMFAIVYTLISALNLDLARITELSIDRRQELLKVSKRTGETK